jgi:hypothetical protein
MSIWWLILLIPIAFGGTLWWRRRIDRTHNAFQARTDLAGDENHARQLLQRHYNKQGGMGVQSGSEIELQNEEHQ